MKLFRFAPRWSEPADRPPTRRSLALWFGAPQLFGGACHANRPRRRRIKFTGRAQPPDIAGSP